MQRFDPTRAAELVATARADRGISQGELASAARMSQPHIAAIEGGSRRVSGALLERILAAADYRPSLPLEAHADEIRASALRHGIAGLRVFGSTLRGEDHFASDIDLIGTVSPGRTYLDVGAFIAEVERLTGFGVDFVVDGAGRPDFLDNEQGLPL